VAIEPLAHQPPHLGRLFVPAIKQLDAAILLAATLAIQGQHAVANPFDARRRRQPVLPTV
jgi:hypothetical protein